MWRMVRRLHRRKYILTGLLLGTCIYLYGIRFTAHRLRRQENERATSLETKSAADDVEKQIHLWENSKKRKVVENVKRKRNIGEGVDAKLPLLLPFVHLPIAVNINNAPEGEEEIFLDKQFDSEDMLQEQNIFPVLELINSISSNQKKKDGSGSTYSNVKDYFYNQQPDLNIIGIQHFPPIKTTSLQNDDNKTLRLLDLWNFDEKCADFQVGLLEDNSLERRALVSFPGSGNSWLRMLIQGVSGIFVDSIYPGGEDNIFHSKANSTYQVPIDCGCTLLQKTHDFSLDAMLFYLPEANRTHTLNEFKGKGILILRNPFSSIRSYRNFDSGGMQGMAPDAAFEGKKWDNFVARSVASWETLAQVWIRGLKQGGIIYYEKLRHEMPSELARLTKMLGLTYDQERLDCVIRHAKDNSFKRNAVSKTTPDPYTASQRLLIHKAIEGVQALLKERGLDPLPTQYYEFFSVLPEYGFPSNKTR